MLSPTHLSNSSPSLHPHWPGLSAITPCLTSWSPSHLIHPWKTPSENNIMQVWLLCSSAHRPQQQASTSWKMFKFLGMPHRALQGLDPQPPLPQLIFCHSPPLILHTCNLHMSLLLLTTCMFNMHVFSTNLPLLTFLHLLQPSCSQPEWLQFTL